MPAKHELQGHRAVNSARLARAASSPPPTSLDAMHIKDTIDCRQLTPLVVKAAEFVHKKVSAGVEVDLKVSLTRL